MTIESRWTGREDAEDGYGQFEDNGPMIHFDNFKDYYYVQRLFDTRKSEYILAGKREVGEAVRRYVEGLK